MARPRVAERDSALAPKRSGADTRSEGASTKVRWAALAGTPAEPPTSKAVRTRNVGEMRRDTRRRISKSRTSDQALSGSNFATQIVDFAGLAHAMRARIDRR